MKETRVGLVHAEMEGGLSVVDECVGGMADRLRQVLANRDECGRRRPKSARLTVGGVRLASKPTQKPPNSLEHVGHLVPNLSGMLYHEREMRRCEEGFGLGRVLHKSDRDKHFRLALRDGEDLMAAELMARGIFWSDDALRTMRLEDARRVRADLLEMFQRKAEADPELAGSPRFAAWCAGMGFDGLIGKLENSTNRA